MLLNNQEMFNRICEALGVTKASEVAEQLGITDGSVSQWKKTGKIALKTFIRVSELSNASIHWLVTGEGERFVKNTGESKNKSVAPDKTAEDTASRSDTTHLPRLQTEIVIVDVPLIGTISASRQSLVLSKEPSQVKVPSILAHKDSVIFRVEGSEWAAEGLHDGDLVIARRPDGKPLQDRIVIARLNSSRVAIGHYHKSGHLVHFSALQGEHPPIRIPETEIEVDYVVTSITRAFE